MTCSFTREQVTEVPVPSSGETVTVDLSLEFYMLAAVGPMDERNPSPIKIDQHEERSSSAEPTPLNSYGSLEPPSNMHIKLHGSLMVIAWYLMASSGVFIARYGKQQFFGIKFMGKDLWFPIHQCLMLSTWLLTLVAFLVMVIEYKFDPLMSLALDLNPHALIGLCATCFMFVQPFMAMMRCHPGHRFRFLFDYAHSMIGFTSLILGAVAIYFATDETFYEKIPMPDAIRTVSLVHIGVLSGIHLALTCYLMYLRFFKKPKDEDDKDESDDKGAWEKERKRKNYPDPMIFTCMVVYVLFNFSITTAMVVYIVKGDDDASV